MIATPAHTTRIFEDLRPGDLIRFARKVRRDPATGCWLWKGHRDGKGYGQFRCRDRAWWAHRWAYAVFVGEIPEGLTVHHTCLCPRCVNPAHMELATLEENTTERNERYNGETPDDGIPF